MALTTTLFIALGLAMDAFAASIATGMLLVSGRVRHALRIALFFGLFQAVMPALGWLIAFRAQGFIRAFDHWIGFVLLACIGSRMIYGSIREKASGTRSAAIGTGLLLTLSIATSIDAFAVGITFAFLDVSVLMPVCIIGLVTFALSLFGVLIAKKMGRMVGRYAGIIGGSILIGIGMKILIEHLMG